MQIYSTLNGANVVIDYSEGAQGCFYNEANNDNKTYSFYLKPICSLIEKQQFERTNFPGYYLQATQKISNLNEKEFYRKCDFYLALFINCCLVDYPLLGNQECNSDRGYLNAIYMFLDLKFNGYVFGIMSIIISLYFLSTNFAKSRDTQKRLTFIICSINGICLTALMLYMVSRLYVFDFAVLKGYEVILIGIGIGIILYILVVKVSIRIFCIFLGILTGFCLTNLLEISFLYQFTFSRYIDFGAASLIFIIFTNCVPFEVFEYQISFCGAFFFVKGVNILWRHD